MSREGSECSGGPDTPQLRALPEASPLKRGWFGADQVLWERSYLATLPYTRLLSETYTQLEHRMAGNVLVVKSGRDKSIRNRHPWVFSGGVKEHPKAKLGEIVPVTTNQGELLGYGFHNPNSRIICRLFELTNTEQSFDEAYWVEKVRNAYTLRQRFLPANTDCYRLVHAEGDLIPGFIADVYGDVVVIQVLVKGTELILPSLLAGLREVGFPTVYLKNKDGVERFEGIELENGWIAGVGEGETPESTREVTEHGLKFLVDIERGQKTGFFLDQRENRRLLSQMCDGMRVLNAFSYTGGFSAYALAGGAASVDSVDVSNGAVEQAEQNVRLNSPEGEHRGIVADCFEYLRSDTTPYDCIVLDPPSFARTPKAVGRASRGYKDINLSAIKRLPPGGLLFTFSCTGVVNRDLFRKIIFGAAADANRPVRVLHQLSQPYDHPVNIYHPEGEYLKGLVLEVG